MQASTMAWDWDTDDIDRDDNDRKLWVPVMAQKLNTGVANGSRPFPFTGPWMSPPQQMTIYAVQPNQDGLAKQASILVLMPIMTPQMKGQIVIKAN